MKDVFFSIARFTGRFTVAIVLWAYAGLIVFTWHLARQTPDWAVLVRVAASLLNDLVWVPLGVVVWSAVFISAVTAIRKKNVFLHAVPVALVTAAIHLVFIDIAFKLLFIPLLVTGASIVWRVARRRDALPPLGWLVPLVLVAALTVSHYRFQMIPAFHGTSSRDGITVMSYNIFYYGGREDRKMVLDTILREKPDVVCCVEFNFASDLELFDRELAMLYPYSIASDDKMRESSAAMVYSKYPVSSKLSPEMEQWGKKWEGWISAVFAEVNVKGKKFNLVSYHLKSVGHYIEYIADKKYTLREKMLWAAGYEEKNDHDKFSQAKALLETVSTFSGPTVLCGDLNDTPNSRAYHIIGRSFDNTFSQKGWGLGATFGEMRIRDKLGRLPLVDFLACDMLRIDHIFTSNEVRVLSSRVITDAHGSDHKPVIAVIGFEP